MVRIAIAGAAGRMGGRILSLAWADPQFEVAAALEKTGHPATGQDAGEKAGLGRIGLPIQDRTATEFDVLIDFTTPDGTMHWLDYCLVAKRGIVIGTTGHSPDQLATIEQAAGSIPVLKAANMSLGVNVLLKVVAEVAAALGDGYDIEIVEAHHRFKMDAPSGTALALRDSILKATGRDANRDVIYGRQGQTGQRPPRQIGMHALRIGDVVGEHEVQFGTLGETVTIKHSAHTRDTFASGALRAAAWLAGKPAGRYDMQDVLGLRG
ncbi:MAG TPA: 4-hydroxy-tetrahydrodipicolinate reductase [Phycisphaerae bacterium]|mgnify:CR=1 FL=1|nr:4-hydroxy-tetrahydrodipicolinate reductase [Phycisphaerae bacterium]